jgi:PAS domain S-box-containing protein
MTKKGKHRPDALPPGESAGSLEATSGSALRRRAEAVALEHAARSPKHPEEISPEKTRRMLHELRVHQIELEMQNGELRQAQEELEASRSKYFELYDLAPVGYLRTNGKGLIIEANLTIAELLGVARDRLVSQPLTGYIVSEDQDTYYLVRNRLVKTGVPEKCELRMRRKDCSLIWAQLDMCVVGGGEDGAPMCRITVSDATERRRMEEEKQNLERKLNLERQIQQEQKLESLSVLAGGIAHDFNNLLMVVLGNAELALKGVPRMSPAWRTLTEITTAGRCAADLCRQMLIFAGESLYSLERVKLEDLIEEMAPLLKKLILKKAILTLRLEQGPSSILVDPTQIQRLMMNLIINASEAIGDESGEITVSTGAIRCDEEYLRKMELHDGSSPGLYVYLEVTDTGDGMDKETRSRIFEPFFSTKFAGRGLGLAAVLGIIRTHKGALKVSSEPGKGTTFKVLFPALEDQEAEEQPLSSLDLSGWRGKGRVLLVDDEESLLTLGARMLKHLGFTVLTAENGLRAVELYREREKEIDLVLMDLTMPYINGVEAFLELRNLNPDVRVILASGYSREDMANRYAGKGLAAILQKPYNLTRLREVLAGVMPKRVDGER